MSARTQDNDSPGRALLDAAHVAAFDRKGGINRAEKPLSRFIPYSTQLDAITLRTKDGDLLRTLKLEGAAFEAADDDDINAWHTQLNILLRNISAPSVALWTHTIRREQNTYPGGDFAPGFADKLNDKYRASLKTARMLVNELYVTIIWRPKPLKAARLLDRFKPFDREAEEHGVREAMAKLDDVARQVFEAFQRYQPRYLRTYLQDRNGRIVQDLTAEQSEAATAEDLDLHATEQETAILYSQLTEFFAFLVNGEYQKIPVTRTPIEQVIGTSRPFCGRDTLELRGATTERYGAALAIKEYPAQTSPGMLNGLLSSHYEFILTQSYICLGKQSAIGIIKRQRDKLINAGDLAETQIEDLDLALNDLTSNEFVYGEHHLSLMVFAREVKQVTDAVAEARTLLADAGMVVVREDIALEAAFWAQLPCNYAMRTRPAPISSLNFAGFTGFHNYPTGKRVGRWGDAIALFKTSSGAPYYFNFHDASGLGNTTIIGPSGSGKTVVQGFLISMLEKAKAHGVFIDKDRGAEIFIRAQRGIYLPLKNGERTGFNPFQLSDTPTNRQFLTKLVKQLATANGEPYSNVDEHEVALAVDGTYSLPQHQRRIATFIPFLNRTSTTGVYTRLQKWHGKGSLAWVFDNESDTLDFTAARLIGFDVTEFLDNKEIRTPMILYLFHRMESIIDGRRFYCFIDEFWKVISDEAFQDFVQNKLKTIRKQNGLIATGTQSVRDALQSPIAHSIIEQSPTQIFMPNPKADHDDYVDGFKLTEREFQIIKTLPEASRRFLIRQGTSSVVAELNLRGFDDELAVLSGTTANVQLLSRIIERVGNDPDVWLPVFHKERKAQ